MPSWLRRAAAPAALAGAVILFYWKLVFAGSATWTQTGDHLNLVLPWWEEVAGQIQRGVLPLWDPWSWGGQPLAGQGQPGAFYPLNWLLFALPLRNGWLQASVLNGWFVAVHVLAGWFAYALARELGRTRAASVLCGLVFGLGGYMGQCDGPQMLNGGVWAPAVFWMLARWMRTGAMSDAALSGLALGMSWLSGHPQAPLLITLAAAGGWLFAAVPASWLRDWRLTRGRALAAAAVSFAIGGLVAAAQVLPLLEYGRYALRFAGGAEPFGFDEKIPYSLHAPFALQPVQVFGIVIPRLVEGMESPWIGFAAAALALFGISAGWREVRVRFLAVLAVAALLYALGPNSLLHGVMYAVVPLLDKARVPGAASVLFTMAAACLAAFGLDYARRRWPAAAAVLPLVVLFELYAGAPPLLDLQEARAWELKSLSAHADVAAFLRDSYPGRFFFSTEELAYNMGEWYALPALNGFAAGVPAGLWKLNVFAAPVQRLMGVRYHVGSKPLMEGLPEVFVGSSGLRVFAAPDPLPRAWIVHQVGRVETVEQGVALVHDAGYDPGRYSYVVRRDPPSLEECSGSEAEVLAYETERVRIRARTRCRGLLILSDTWFPGWKAWVDGREAEILPAYGALRGVVVEAGAHEVEMRYRPASVALGAALSFAGLVAAALLVWRGRGSHTG
jgi:hypothetical protein